MRIAGTTTLQQVVASVPSALRLLVRLRIDTVGEHTLAEACMRAGVSLEDVLGLLNARSDGERRRQSAQVPSSTPESVTVGEQARRVPASAPPPVQHLVHSHESVGPVLAEAMLAFERLRQAPRSYTAAEHCSAAFEFVFGYALPHMDTEDHHHFPLLADAGAPLEALYLLGEDHAMLRQLASNLSLAGLVEGAEALSDKAVEYLGRFIELFRWHAEREEKILAQLAVQLAPPPRR